MQPRVKQNAKRRRIILFSTLAVLTAAAFSACLTLGSTAIPIKDFFAVLSGKGSTAHTRIIYYIRLPRAIAAAVAGAALAVSGLIMQTTLKNVMASPSTLGVSNAAVFGANLSIIVLAGGSVTLGVNMADKVSSFDPFAVSSMAFGFAALSTLAILALCRVKSFSPSSIVLAGVAVGAIWTAGTTLVQFFATDVGLSAAVLWSFGDLGRATFAEDNVMLAAVAAGLVFFIFCSWKYNAMLGGDDAAKTAGVNVELLRIISLLICSLLTAVCVSFLGIIGFVGVICPHVAKKAIGHDHRASIPFTALTGSFLLLFADVLGRLIGGGTALPVGAITSLLGAPFFLALLFSAKEKIRC